MIDREKVIKGLESCAKWMGENDDNACNSCPYHHSHFSYDDNNCIAIVNNDAITLLKEQKTSRSNISKKQMEAWLKDRQYDEWANRAHEMGV